MDMIPDYSIFSQNRRRRLKDSEIFRQIFNRILEKCIKAGLVSGDTAVSDGSFISANVSWYSKVEITRVVEKSTVDYLETLDEELKQIKGYVEASPVFV